MSSSTRTQTPKAASPMTSLCLGAEKISSFPTKSQRSESSKRRGKLPPLPIPLVSEASSNSDLFTAISFPFWKIRPTRVTAQAEPESAELPASHRKRFLPFPPRARQFPQFTSTRHERSQSLPKYLVRPGRRRYDKAIPLSQDSLLTKDLLRQYRPPTEIHEAYDAQGSCHADD